MSDDGWDIKPAPDPDGSSDSGDRTFYFWVAFSVTALVTFFTVAMALCDGNDGTAALWTSLWIALGAGLTMGILTALFGRRFWEFMADLISECMMHR